MNEKNKIRCNKLIVLEKQIQLKDNLDLQGTKLREKSQHG